MLVKGREKASSWMQGYDGGAAELVHKQTEGVAVVAFVHNDVSAGAQMREQEGFGLIEIGDVRAGQKKAEWVTECVTGQVNLGGEAGSGAAHRLRQLATCGAGAMRMHPHRGTVDEEVLVVSSGGQSGMQRLPKSVARPSTKTRIDALPGTEYRWQIAPRYAGAQDPEDPFDPQAWIPTGASTPLRPA